MFIGTQLPKESLWYGQLEPGKKYHLEVWLRQDGLADNGEVRFSYGKGYPQISQTFPSTARWKKYTFDFTGPERPANPWHFGHQFTFTGPGTLWMDNCRIFRCDSPRTRRSRTCPTPPCWSELLKTQPDRREGRPPHLVPHRDATMSSILSWHANSQVSLDWSTSVEGTMAMTLPDGLTFDLATGKDPQSRMRPWLVIQHILHSRAGLAGPDRVPGRPLRSPSGHAPARSPGPTSAFRQRGTGTPWTDEFAEIVIEFGNETWHNGIFDDWLGFHTAQRDLAGRDGIWPVQQVSHREP